MKQQDKTCVPVVEATEEQRETLHQKAIGKHKEIKVEWEIFLRYGDIEGEFYVDVREDIVDPHGDIVNGGEYVEGFIFDDYNEAKEKFIEVGKIYEEKIKTSPFPWPISVNYDNEVEHG